MAAGVGPGVIAPLPANTSTGLAITWLGHATVLLDLDGARVLTDPVLGDRIGPLVRIAPSPPADRLDRLDAVVLSHLHADHADVRSLRRVAGAVPVIAPEGARDWLHAKGLSHVEEIRTGCELRIGPLRVMATPALHDARRWPFGPAADPVGYVIAGSISAYFAGDTDLFDGIGELRGDVDVAMLPVSGWGRTLPRGHLDPERAARAAALIAPRVAMPIHWGTFALPRAARGTGETDAPAREFAARCERAAPGVEVRILYPGETTMVC
jgi:L-ascorbate metabolism protein UlaG (beta-lactamase superfamily)